MSTAGLYQPTQDLDRRLEEIRSVVEFVEPPHTPTSPEELAAFFLGPPPNRDRQPAHYTFWETMRSPSRPLHVVTPEFDFDDRHRERRYASRRVGVSTGRSRSLNWSGAFITPRDGRMFTEVCGSWKVPRVSPPADAPADAEYEYDSSIWIGLDGQREYLDSSLPQIGTAQYVKIAGGQPQAASTTIWWQWWLEHHWNPPPITLVMPVEPDDLVMCSLTVVDETHVKYLVMNHRTGQLCWPFIVPAPVATLQKPFRKEVAPEEVPLKVSGATAQWIAERPTIWRTEEFYELPDYESVEVGDCHAVSALAPGQAGREETLEGDTLINMYTVKTNPHRTEVISVAERLATDRVKMSYRR